MSARGKPAQEDIELVTRALAGSEDAYRDLLTRYERPVFALIRRMVRDTGLAEDLAQEVFVKAFRALGSFDRSRRFSNWLFKIAHNTAIDQLRRRQIETVALERPDREGPDLMAVLPDTVAESPDKRLERQNLAAAIETAIAALRPEYRVVIVLRYQEGLPYDEIAEVTGLPLGTVKTHIFRARQALARHLAAGGWAPSGS